MSTRHFLRFHVIKLSRYILRKKFLPIFEGPLKGYAWSTAANYDYLLGTYEDPQTLRTFLSWLQADSVFYDVGANAGYYTLLAEQRIKSGIIYCFEPMPYNIELFSRHLQLNQDKISAGCISLQPFALSDGEREVAFSNDSVAPEGNTYVKTSGRFMGASTIKINTRSIDSLVKSGFRPPHVIKIDVEGAELDVLKGAAETLRTYKPHILLATHDGHLPGVKDACIALLASMGYTLQHTGFFNKHVAGHDDYIAIHKDKPFKQA